MATVDSTVTDGQPGTGLPTPSGVGLSADDVENFYPLGVAVGDVLVGGLLFSQFTPVLGFVMAAIGVVVFCALACQFLAGRVPVPAPLRTWIPTGDS